MARAKKTVYDGQIFDSGSEARRWAELRLLEAAGEIQNLRRQPKFVLQNKFKCPWTGKTIRELTYTGDFAYTENGHEVIEDAKGKTAPLTQQFEVRWKLARFQNQDKEFRIVRVA